MPVRVDVTIPGLQEAAGSAPGETVLVCPDVNPLALGGEEPRYHVSGFRGTVSDDLLEFSLNFGQYPTYFTGRPSS